ncbi:MAG: peptide-methionine (S)-S-oxide reductase MsrA [Pirellulaceae bacterium]
MNDSNSNSVATFGGGCFWCTEAVFAELKGVHRVTSGYSGGKLENPTYEDICRGDTGHAEVIQIEYDPAEVTFEDLLEVFFQTHDPTTLNRQGNDVGTQYRSVIFYHDEDQQKTAQRFIEQLTESKAFASPIVTELSPAPHFYPAEQYHQNYLPQNPGNPYCMMVVRPKVDKFRKQFANRLK